ncbi:MAG: hypothetical protein PHD43_12925 [Methylococcales bacterium]|nr:hypothetical protein [Methylococcales bacterium]
MQLTERNRNIADGFAKPVRLSTFFNHLFSMAQALKIGHLFTSPEKQENINEILKTKGSNYRIGNIKVKIGFPHKMIYDLKSLADE